MAPNVFAASSRPASARKQHDRPDTARLRDPDVSPQWHAGDRAPPEYSFCAISATAARCDAINSPVPPHSSSVRGCEVEVRGCERCDGCERGATRCHWTETLQIVRTPRADPRRPAPGGVGASIACPLQQAIERRLSAASTRAGSASGASAPDVAADHRCRARTDRPAVDERNTATAVESELRGQQLGVDRLIGHEAARSCRESPRSERPRRPDGIGARTRSSNRRQHVDVLHRLQQRGVRARFARLLHDEAARAATRRPASRPNRRVAVIGGQDDRRIVVALSSASARRPSANDRVGRSARRPRGRGN